MKIVTVGGNAKFIQLIDKISGGKAMAFDTVEGGLAYVKKANADVLFLLPFYDRGEVFIPEFLDEEIELLTEIIETQTTKIYIENYPAYDYRDCFVLGLQARTLINNLGKYSVCLCGDYKDGLGFEILQKRNGFYYPNGVHTHESTRVLAEIKNCFGVHRIVKSEQRREGVALLQTGDNVYCAMVDLTNLKDNEIFPYGHWQDFYGRLLHELTGEAKETIKTAFSSIYKKVGIRQNVRPKDRRLALEQSLEKAVAWHRRSGVLIDGGTGGVYEMIRSFDLQLAKNVRGDSSLMTAALFYASGKYFSCEEDIETAENIVRNILDERKLQIEDGANKGLFKWFAGVSSLGPRSIYVSDSSRVGNAVLALYQLSGRDEFKDRAVALGDALLQWFGGEALLPGCSFNYDTADVRSLQENYRVPSPEFYDAPIIFLGNLYAVTGDERYREQILKTAKHLATVYPNYETATSHSDNFTYSRLLGVFAVAQRFGNGAWTPVISELLAYFKKLQHESGGFFDDKAYFDEKSLLSDVEFAVGYGGNGEHIADFVYCQNTMAYVLNILLSCKTGDFDRAETKEMFDKLIEFLLDTQISSSDGRFDGAWMRAFDMDHMDYYGCDKDFAWGPYCILTGWVTGAIPLVFLDLLGVKTIY